MCTTRTPSMHDSVASHQMSALVGACTVGSLSEQVLTGHQMSLTGRGRALFRTEIGVLYRGGGALYSEVQWVIVTWDPPQQNDRRP